MRKTIFSKIGVNNINNIKKLNIFQNTKKYGGNLTTGIAD